MGYDENKMARAAAGTPEGGQWTSRDASRGDFGQVMDSMEMAEAMGNDEAAEMARLHLREVAVADLAALETDIPLIRRGGGSWELDYDYPEGRPDEDPYRASETLHVIDDIDDETEDAVVASISAIGDDEVSAIADPPTYEVVETPYATRPVEVVERTTMRAERLASRAANEGWATAPEQDDLFGGAFGPEPFEPTTAGRNLSERDPDEELGSGYLIDRGTGHLEHARLRVGDFAETGWEGIYRTDDSTYVMLDPWRASTIDPEVLDEARVPGTEFYRGSALDDHIPFEPSNPDDVAMLKRLHVHGFTPTPLNNHINRAMLAAAHLGGERAEQVQNLVHSGNVDLSRLDGSASEYPDDYVGVTAHEKQVLGWASEKGVFPQVEKGEGYPAYQLDEATNNRIPEGLRTSDGFYSGDRAHVVTAVLHPEPEEARNAISLLADLSHDDHRGWSY